MPKKLTLDQLGEVKCHNPYEFCGDGFYLSFTPYSRQTMTSFGWKLVMRNRRVISFHGSEITGRSKPEEMRSVLEPILCRFFLSWPEKWTRFMGVWMPTDLFTSRMAHFVALRAEVGEQD